MVYDTNAFLTLEEKTVNAQFILDFLLGRGWTKNAVCGMLGNMQSESSINFGIYEGLDNTSSTNGFGLVQWTPNTKYFDWANANGYSGDHVNGELNRILYEVENNLQWFGGYSSSMSFQQFTQSTETPEYLAEVFIKTYEHPANPDQPIRGTQARYWFDNLNGNGTITPPPTTSPQNNVIALLLCDALNGWKW
jgi:hypothetical protein